MQAINSGAHESCDKSIHATVKSLHRVNGDKVSSMGFLYGDLEIAKEKIKEALGGNEKK